MISELLWEFIALQKPRYDEPCSIIFSDLCSGKVYNSCTAVLQLRVITQFSANRRWATEVIFAAIPLMISSSSLWLILNPSFFPRVDISAAVCDAQRVGSWPYKVMSALTRAGLMTLSAQPILALLPLSSSGQRHHTKNINIKNKNNCRGKMRKGIMFISAPIYCSFQGFPWLLTNIHYALYDTLSHQSTGVL